VIEVLPVYRLHGGGRFGPIELVGDVGLDEFPKPSSNGNMLTQESHS
jgi:hypothetical protein